MLSLSPGILMVRAAPEQYLWMHRIWKSRPRHERQGRAVPNALIDKLRALPWMDEAAVSRVVEDSNRLSHAAAGRAGGGDAGRRLGGGASGQDTVGV